MSDLKIYRCSVQVKEGEELVRPAEIFVLGRNFKEVEHAATSDPNIKIMGISLFTEPFRADLFYDKANDAEGGYQGLNLFPGDNPNYLHEEVEF